MRLRVPGDHVRILVRVAADAVPDAVDEVVAEPGRRDHVARGRVDRFARRSDGRGLHARFLRGREHGVHVADLGGGLADVEHARDVGAVAAASCRRSRRARARPSPMIRSADGSWCGLAACAPAATMAKFDRSCPASSMRSTSSRCTSSSVRPANGRRRISAATASTACGGAAQRVDLGVVLDDAAARR